MKGAEGTFIELLDRALDAINLHLIMGDYSDSCTCPRCNDHRALAKARDAIQVERAKILYPNLDHGTQASGEAQARPGQVGPGEGPLAQGS